MPEAKVQVLNRNWRKWDGSICEPVTLHFAVLKKETRVNELAERIRAKSLKSAFHLFNTESFGLAFCLN